MNPRLLRAIIFFLALALVTLACGLFDGEDVSQVTPTQMLEVQPTEPPVSDEPAAPTELPEQLLNPEVPLGEEYRSLEGGFAFHPLPDYVLEEFFGFVTMISPDGNPDSGPAIVMIGDTIDEELTLDEFYDTQMSEISTEDVEFSTPLDVTIGGKPGQSVKLSGTADDGVAVAGKMTIVLASPTQTWILLGIAPVDQWDDFSALVDAVEITVSFFEPQIESIEPGSSELPDTLPQGEEYRSEEGGYLFIAIPDYTLEENDGSTTLIAPDGDENIGPAIFMMGEELYEEHTLDELYEEQMKYVDSDDQTLSAPYDVTVGGSAGRSVDIKGADGDQPIAGRIIIVLVNPNQMFLTGAISPADRWVEFSPIFESLVNSIDFFEPGSDAGQSGGLLPKGDEIRQWATYAYASSSYDDPDYHAVRATKKPDVPVGECVDHPNAWAPLEPDTVEWLELLYDTPVIPTQINIIQTHSPDQVVKVELVDMTGAYREVYTAVPENLWDECPFTLSIPVEVDYAVVGVKITIDQSVIPTTWNEIDAVELVGYEFQEGGTAPPKDEKPPVASTGDLSLQEPPVPSQEAGQINERLLELGYEICNPSDFFSPQTASAVKEFQRINGLVVSGIVDSQTWDLLFSEAALPVDKTAQELIFSESLEGVTGDKLASSGSLLWLLSKGFNFLEAYDTNTGELAGIFSVENLPGEENYVPQAIAYDKERLWIASLGDGDAIVQAYDPNTDPVEGIMTPQLSESVYVDDVSDIRGLSYDGQHLWVAYTGTAYPSGIAEINRLSNEVTQVFEFGLDEFASAPAFDSENLWAAFEGVVMGDAILAVNPDSGALGEASGFCGYQVAHDLAALWVAKEYEVLAVHPYGGGDIYGRATFESRIKDITFSGARIYLLFEDGTIRFYQVY